MSEFSSQLPTRFDFLKIDVADHVPGLRHGMLLRTAWGLEPGLVRTIGHSTVHIDLRRQQEKLPEELDIDQRRIITIPVHQANAAKRAGQDAGRVEYTEMYRDMLGSCRPAVVRLFDAVAGALEHGAVLGCSMGKDRTGVLVALILAGIGVPTNAIVAAERSAREVIADAVRRTPNAGPPLTNEQILRLLRTAPESIGDCLEQCEQAHGSVAGYLAAIGIPGKTMRVLRTLREI
jgi:protein-tyrosine phosphatase